MNLNIEMKVSFRTYQGLAGELNQMLICESEHGHKETCLYSIVGPFKLWKLRRAKKKLIKRMELLTGKQIKEL